MSHAKSADPGLRPRCSSGSSPASTGRIGPALLGFDWFGVLGHLEAFEQTGLWGWLALLAGIGFIMASFGLWAMQPWAWTFTIILAGFALFEALLWFIEYPGTGIGFSAALMPLVIRWYLNTDDIKSQFGQAPGPSDPDDPRDAGGVSFDVAAEAYDRFMGRYSRRLAPSFADLAGVQAGQRILDVGCGPGATANRMDRPARPRSADARRRPVESRSSPRLGRGTQGSRTTGSRRASRDLPDGAFEAPSLNSSSISWRTRSRA